MLVFSWSSLAWFRVFMPLQKIHFMHRVQPWVSAAQPVNAQRVPKKCYRVLSFTPASGYFDNFIYTFFYLNDIIWYDFFFKRRNGLIARGSLRVAENVAYGFNSAASVLNGWLNSPSHRSVIEGEYTHVGIGVLSSEDSRFYYTCIFYKWYR